MRPFFKLCFDFRLRLSKKNYIYITNYYSADSNLPSGNSSNPLVRTEFPFGGSETGTRDLFSQIAIRQIGSNSNSIGNSIGNSNANRASQEAL